MSGHRIVHSLRKFRFLPLLFLLFAMLACQATASPTPTTSINTSDETKTVYPTGIETRHLDNGVVAVFDHKGHYGMGFYDKWKVGAFDGSFVPTVQKYSQTNQAIQSLFNQIYLKDPSLRIFASDTAPEHLTKDSIAVLYIGTHDDVIYRNATLDDLVTEYTAYLYKDSKGTINVTQTMLGKSNYGIPFVILTTKSTPPNSEPVYGASVLIQTDTTYIEMLYTTFDPAINVVDELSPILSSFGTFVE